MQPGWIRVRATHFLLFPTRIALHRAGCLKFGNEGIRHGWLIAYRCLTKKRGHLRPFCQRHPRISRSHDVTIDHVFPTTRLTKTCCRFDGLLVRGVICSLLILFFFQFSVNLTSCTIVIFFVNSTEHAHNNIKHFIWHWNHLETLENCRKQYPRILETKLKHCINQDQINGINIWLGQRPTANSWNRQLRMGPTWKGRHQQSWNGFCFCRIDVYCIHSWLSLITVACAVWLVEKGTVQ